MKILIRQVPVFASTSSRNITKSMIRTRSSNIWGYKFWIKDNRSNIGDLYVQFKNAHGGPGDVYVLYEVPLRLYKRFISTTSRGHFYWKYFRDNFKYSKLTGDKKGKLPNAIN